MCLGGGILLAMGVVRSLLATGTFLESSAGLFLEMRSDIITVEPFLMASPLIRPPCYGVFWTEHHKLDF